MRGVKTGAVALVLAVTLAGCSLLPQGLFVSGISLEQVGVQFIAISEQVTIGCEQKVIPDPTCAKYRAFGLNFKKTYPLAVGMWQAARKADDKATQEKAEDVVRGLASDLTKLAAEALSSFQPGVK